MGTSISSSFESKAVKEPYLTVSSKVGVPPTKVFDLERHLRLAMVSNESGMFSKISPSEEERKDKMILHAREEDLKELMTEDSVPVNLNEREVKYPFSAVGIVLSIRKNRTIIGTGSLIGPNLVLTCAHNCFDATKRAMDQEVRFIPSEIEGRLRREQLSNENVGFKARYVYVPQQYKGMDLQKESIYNEGLLYDYALIVLDTDINLEAYFGTLGFDFNWQESSYYKETVEKDKSMKVVEIYGYPLLYDGPEYRLFKGSAYNDQSYLLYTMNTKGGVSGAPVLLHHGDCSTIRGIHVRDVSGMLQFAGKGALKLSHQMLVDISNNASQVRVEHIYNMGNRKLQDEDLLKILRKIEKNESKLGRASELKIIVTWNQITAKGCSFLTQMSCHGIHTLNLAKNNIQDKGCWFLSQALWKQLHTLNLGSNNISDEGCQHLSRGEWPRLHELYLGWNSINDQGCLFLAEGKWRNMGVLKLWGNKVGEQAQGKLASLGWSVQIYSKKEFD